MFIGPLTVYFGASSDAAGASACASVFTLVSVVLPFVHGYSLLIVLLGLAGLTAGTFYPLTLSFALRNIRSISGRHARPLCDHQGAVNFAPSLYGFEQDHLSWAWMFWTSAVVTPVMMACVFYGIPDSPRPRPSDRRRVSSGSSTPAAAWRCSLPRSIRGAARLVALGVFTALFAAGAFLLLCAVVRRLRMPNPLVDLPYLARWNTVILGFGLFAFRFALLATIIIIPQSLSVRGLDAAQLGPAVLGTASAELLLAVFAAHLLNKGVDSRLVMAVGFATIAFACVLNADYTSAWSAESYFRSELLMAAGQTFAMVGLVSTIVLQAFFSGGLESPYRILTFSAFFHVVRLFGGQIGVTVMTHFIAEREKVHSFLVGLQVQPGDWSPIER